MSNSISITKDNGPPHPRRVGWLFSAAVAVGGSNLSLFLFSSLISGQGSAGILLIMIGMVISLFSLFGWIELTTIFRNRVGGISASSAAAIRQQNGLLANIIGFSYWSATIPGAAYAAQTIATILQKWLLPDLSVSMTATGFVIFFALVNLLGVHQVARLVVPTGILAVLLAIISGLIPVLSGHVNWHQAFTYQLIQPFEGSFGTLTAIMAGLYLVAFSAPAYEQGAGYVGETIKPEKNIPRAMYAASIVSILYYLILPTIWLGALGADALAKADLTQELIPTFIPAFGVFALYAAILFMLSNALLCLVSALSIMSRELAQISEDGLMPSILSWRSQKTDSPWVAILVTAITTIAVLWLGAPIWLMAATNFEYILCVALASIIVWWLRRHYPDLERPYRAPKGTLLLGLIGAIFWAIITILGYQQFGLVAVIGGLIFPFSGIPFYIWRRVSDARKQGKPLLLGSLQIKLTLTIFTVLTFDAIGYLIAVNSIGEYETALIAALEDIFIIVALLTITVGLILPSRIAQAATEIADAAEKLSTGTVGDFSRAMQALGKGDLEAANARVDINPVVIHTGDELERMANSFNQLQNEIAKAAIGLVNAREGLLRAQNELKEMNETLEQRVIKRTQELKKVNDDLKITLDSLRKTQSQLIESEKMASLGGLVAGVAHEVNTPLGIAVTSATYLDTQFSKIISALNNNTLTKEELEKMLHSSDETIKLLENNLLRATDLIASFKQTSADHTKEDVRKINLERYLYQIFTSLDPEIKKTKLAVQIRCPSNLEIETNPGVLFQVITILVVNSITHGFERDEVGKISVDVQSNKNEIIIRYSDDGKGIAHKIRGKIFEPFFTTRRAAGGIGLGLYIAYNKVVQTLHGTIKLDDNPDQQGIAFIITLPI